MLADSVEAASKTLADPTPARIQGMVQKIINGIFIDGQLDECELTLKNLHAIANSFNRILASGVFHHRIEYPQLESEEGGVRKKRMVKIKNQQSKIKISRKWITEVMNGILSVLGYQKWEISILLVDDLQITKLNESYLHRNGPTDVIAFSQLEGAFSHLNNHLLGDVVISLETAQRQAQEDLTTLQDEIIFLLIHGTLHLLGYDHEGTVKQAREMQAKQQEVKSFLQGSITLKR